MISFLLPVPTCCTLCAADGHVVCAAGVWLLLQVGLKYGLPLLSPVDDAGCFTDEAGPAFAGLAVQGEGNTAVVDALAAAGVLLKQEQYAHKYPYDWRTKKPTIFRATSQWFASVEGFRWGG